MNNQQKYKILRDIVEERKFHELLRDLFINMGYKEVIITHGADEDGKDLVMYEISKIKEKEFKAVVAKIGDISGASTVKDSASLTNIEQQIRLCFNIPFYDPETKQKENIRSVFVATNGNISNNARRKIVSTFGEKAVGDRANVNFISSHKLKDLIDEHYSDYFLYGDSFISRYFSKLRIRLERLTDMQIFEYKGETKKINDIYIEPQLRVSKDPGSRLSPKQVISPGFNVLIVGQMGAGKSTLMKNLVLEAIERCTLSMGKKHGQIPLENIKIPIFTKFKDLDSNRTIIEILEQELEIGDLEGHKFDVEDHLRNGLFVFFLDGLDEVTDKSVKDKIIEKIYSFSSEYPKVQIIIASREIEYLELNQNLGVFKRYEILPLDASQIDAFIRKWFKAKRLDMQRMLKALQDTLMLHKLPKTPMVMTLLSIIMEQGSRKELPSTMTELYSLATEVFLRRWDVEKNITAVYEYPIKENFLMELAFMFHMSKREEIPIAEMVEFTDIFIKELNISRSKEEFLNEVVERSQLIWQNENGAFQFKHVSFQDYFAAKAIKELYPNKIDIEKGFADLIWEGILFFYCGLKKKCPDEVIQIISTWRDSGKLEEIRKFILFGHILQASFLNPFMTKIRALEFVLDKWAGLLIELKKNPPKELELSIKRMTEENLILSFKNMFSMYYGSVVLSDALIEIYDSLNINSGPIDENNLEGFRLIGLKKYFIASTLAELNKPEYLLKFLEEGPRGNINLINLIKNDMGRLVQQGSFVQVDKELKGKIKKTIHKRLARINSGKKKNWNNSRKNN